MYHLNKGQRNTEYFALLVRNPGFRDNSTCSSVTIRRSFEAALTHNR